MPSEPEFASTPGVPYVEFPGTPLVAGVEARRILGLEGAKFDEVSAPELQRLIDASGATVVDFAQIFEDKHELANFLRQWGVGLFDVAHDFTL